MSEYTVYTFNLRLNDWGCATHFTSETEEEKIYILMKIC